MDTSPKPFSTISHLKETLHPSETPSRPTLVERPRALGRGKGPFTPPKPPLLMNDATYAMEQVMSIIKEEDINDCDEYALTTIGESRLHDLAKVFPLHPSFFLFFFLTLAACPLHTHSLLIHLLTHLLLTHLFICFSSYGENEDSWVKVWGLWGPNGQHSKACEK